MPLKISPMSGKKSMFVIVSSTLDMWVHMYLGAYIQMHEKMSFIFSKMAATEDCEISFVYAANGFISDCQMATSMHVGVTSIRKTTFRRLWMKTNKISFWWHRISTD
jgi:hypothetical protein